jgi:Tfp pilus assembly protein PilO
MNFNFLSNLDIKQKIATTIVVLVGVVFLSLYFFVFNTIQDINELRNEIISEKIEIEKKINREKNLSNLSIKLKKIESQSNKIENIFLMKNNELEFIKTIEDIAAYNNVSQNINLLPGKDEKKIHKTIVNLNLEGNYENILNYIIDLESLTQYINITNLNISAQDNKEPEEDSRIILNISAETFWK